MTTSTRIDSIEWMREHWTTSGHPRAAHACAAVSVLRTAALLSVELDRQLKELNLNRTSYLLLVTLRMSDGAIRPLGQLSNALLVHPTTVTASINQLEKYQLVERLPHPTDRRLVLAKLTAKGHSTVRHANRKLAAVGFCISGTDEQTADRIVDDLKTMRTALSDLR